MTFPLRVLRELTLSLVAILFLFSSSAGAQAPLITTIAGSINEGYSGDGGSATSAEMHSVISVAIDAANNIYIVDADNYCIRKVSAGTGIITTVVGNGTPGYSGDGGPATNAQLSPSGIAIDAVGNMYITDAGAEVIRKVTAATGIITTIAGNGSYGYSGDGGLATAAKLGDPQGIALDAAANIYFADSNNNAVREVNASTGIITTIAGNGAATYGGDGGLATAASIHYPIGVAIDSSNNIYIAEQYSDRIREVAASTGIISTIAGSGTLGYTGDGGAATSATLSMPSGVAFDTSGNMYIADGGNSVVRVVKASTGTILTVAGNGVIGYTGDNKPATSVALYFPTNITVDGNGNLDIADTNNNMVRQVEAPIIWDPSTFDSGTVTLTVGGVPESASYNSTTNTTSSAIAAALDSALNADPNSPVTATLSGSTLTLTSKQPGTASDYSYSLTSTYDSQDFTQGSFSANPASGSLSGGTDANTVPTQIYKYVIPQNGGYAPNGNLLSYTDSVMGSWTFGYDSLNRLISGTATPAYGQNSFYCWSYDSFGNRTNQSGSDQNFVSIGGTSPCQPASSANLTTDVASYNSANQIISTNANGTTVSPSYDPAGDMIDDGSHVYLYDPEGRICAVGTPAAPPLDATNMTQYLYDAEGHRVAKGTISVWNCDVSSNGFTLTNQYMLGPSGEQMTELDGSGNPIHTNVYVNGSLLATYDDDGLHFHLTDWLGTRRAQTNFAGSLEATYQSLPYGEMPIGQLLGPTEQHFTGKERDQKSGLDYFGARYYASSMGRFMSPDWSKKPEGVPYADLSNPQSLNLYEYVLNNPLHGVDPDGHCSAPTVQGGHVGICLESYIQMARFGALYEGHGDDRGPVGNDPRATFRTQTMIDVNLGAQSATEHSVAGLSVTTHFGSEPGVVHHSISDPKKGSDGSTTFTVTVYGENGFEAKGKMGAPGGWIEMVFTLKVAADGTVTVESASTKDFPSVSIYSYQSDGTMTNVYQQTESGNVNDLNKPRKSRTPRPGFCSAEFASCN